MSKPNLEQSRIIWNNFEKFMLGEFCRRFPGNLPPYKTDYERVVAEMLARYFRMDMKNKLMFEMRSIPVKYRVEVAQSSPYYAKASAWYLAEYRKKTHCLQNCKVFDRYILELIEAHHAT